MDAGPAVGDPFWDFVAQIDIAVGGPGGTGGVGGAGGDAGDGSLSGAPGTAVTVPMEPVRTRTVAPASRAACRADPWATGVTVGTATTPRPGPAGTAVPPVTAGTSASAVTAVLEATAVRAVDLHKK